ncbi:MAG: rRNA maturation RNase YbeY [Bacilli bacterium]|nr:rRNA maturation RNase YbeY [Bacilli bacterium]
MYEVLNKTNEEVENIDDIRKALDFALKKEKIENSVFNVIIVDNSYIHKLNRDYRNIDKATDVITFALEDEKDMILPDKMRILGDIYISLDKAKEQALEYGHSLKRELTFLAIHGFYHLLGYDHMTKEEEKEMFKKQKEVLDNYEKGC